ncbi:MAG: FAD-dependent thymidylate synthase, partial [Candidatus Jacksonbacteria bacterium]|nr:FAD-dependent thymidylate synthase [Anaerolineae bacterium]MBT7338187.1 FAD-dependent thymidylate synthase [Candidatus Jacksonbacteria bacterium]
LIKLLGPTIRDEFHALFPARANRPDRWERFLERKAYEIARYVLPIATYTHLYHTVSALTLMRYARMRDYIDFPAETALLVNAMLDAVLEIDPDFERELDDPFPLEETPEYAFIASRSDVVGAAAAHHQEFDNELGGLPSLLIDYPANAQETLAKAVRSVLGESSASLSTEDAIALVLNPAKNPHLADMLGPTTMSKLTRALAVVTYVFQKKLSHTADSQDQRHRMVPSTAPVLAATYTGIPDVVMPTLIGMNERAQELFERVIKQTTEGINKLLEMGVPTEFALYLLPNAHAVRKVSSGTLANLLPKGRQRLCYAAQEEIFHAMAAEAAQVTAKHPAIGQWLHAPCRLRQQASETPYCPEGTRFCGVPVWKLDVHEFDRVL